MCWSQSYSIAFFIIGTLGAFLIRFSSASLDRHHSNLLFWPLLYFSSMELLQAVQYQYIDQCQSDVNHLLTYIAYIHIAFQPLFFNMWNGYFMRPSVRSRMLPVILPLCCFASALLLTRLFSFYPSIAGGSGAPICTGGVEPLCSGDIAVTCSYTGQWHLAWKLPLTHSDYNYYTPGIAIHFFLFFVPPFCAGMWKTSIVFFLLGPFLAHQLSNDPNESPAVWCLFSIPVMIMSVPMLIMKHHRVHASLTQRAMTDNNNNNNNNNNNSSSSSNNAISSGVGVGITADLLNVNIASHLLTLPSFIVSCLPPRFVLLWDHLFGPVDHLLYVVVHDVLSCSCLWRKDLDGDDIDYAYEYAVSKRYLTENRSANSNTNNNPVERSLNDNEELEHSSVLGAPLPLPSPSSSSSSSSSAPMMFDFGSTTTLSGMMNDNYSLILAYTQEQLQQQHLQQQQLQGQQAQVQVPAQAGAGAGSRAQQHRSSGFVNGSVPLSSLPHKTGALNL